MVERAPRLEGKVAIITGAGSSGEGIGNGKAAAILMAREGAKVLLVDQMESRAQETLEIIKSEGGEASTCPGGHDQAWTTASAWPRPQLTGTDGSTSSITTWGSRNAGRWWR